jgi:uncharacterized phage-associated protein/DNA-binding transcriptional regulator YiaG
MIARQIESPFADGFALLHQEAATEKFRKEEFSFTYHHYVCQVTGQSFTTDELDNVNVNQVYSQYRQKHQIMFPEQIQQLRERYQLSAARMSLLLDFGPNQYRSYEDGEIPSDSNAAHLRLARNPRTFREMVRAKKDKLRPIEFAKLEDHLLALIQQDEENFFTSDQPFLSPTLRNPRAIPDEYTGYTVPNQEKFAEMVLYFFEHCQHLYLVRLNKLLFYADFLHYKSTGRSLSGYRYQAISYGPVPERYEMHFGLLVDEKLLTRSIDPERKNSYNGQSIVNYSPTRSARREVFSSAEWATLETICEQLGRKSRETIVQLSHEEDAWVDNEQAQAPISYQQYAFKLKALTH